MRQTDRRRSRARETKKKNPKRKKGERPEGEPSESSADKRRSRGRCLGNIEKRQGLGGGSEREGGEAGGRKCVRTAPIGMADGLIKN